MFDGFSRFPLTTRIISSYHSHFFHILDAIIGTNKTLNQNANDHTLTKKHALHVPDNSGLRANTEALRLHCTLMLLKPRWLLPLCLCIAEFGLIQKSNLRRHIITSHERPVKCPKCHERFATIAEATSHFDVNHPGGGRPRIRKARQPQPSTFRWGCGAFYVLDIFRFDYCTPM